MDMDDDDFMGEVEFDLSDEQRQVISRAIDLASQRRDDAFQMVNPLIAIVQWWQSSVPETERLKGPPEAVLAEACRLYLLAHQPSVSKI